MTLAVSIRAEQLGDCGPICQVIHEAFRNHPHSSQTEHLTVNALRAAGALELSLVATAGNQLVGHVAFTRVEISDNTDGWYGLGPVAVKPEFHGRGIGTALIESGLAGLQERRAHGCVLLGDPKFSDRFGFSKLPRPRTRGSATEILPRSASRRGVDGRTRYLPPGV